MRGGLCVLTPFCDRITIQNPVKVVYRCRTPPYLTCIFRKKTKHFHKFKKNPFEPFFCGRVGTGTSDVQVPVLVLTLAYCMGEVLPMF